MQETKRKWVAPQITRYGTFEAATQSCTNKDYGTSDILTFEGLQTVCTS